MRPFVRCLPVLLAIAFASSHAATAMLRVACEGQDVGAEVFVNGVFKGECPVDIAVPPGSIKLRAVKSFDGTRESVFEQDFRMAEDTSKRVNLQLGPPQLTVKGRQVVEENQRRQRAEAERQAQEKAKADLQSARQMQAQADASVTATLATARAKLPSSIPDCPDCPGMIKPAGGFRMETPAVNVPEINGWLEAAKREAGEYIATAGQSFRPPAQLIPMPCSGAEEAMKALAGLNYPVDQSGDASRKYREAMRGYNGVFVYAREVQLWPVQATCEAGQLSGPLDFWAAGTNVMGYNGNVIATPTLTHMRANMVAGKATGVMVTTTHSRSFSNPSVLDLMLKSDALIIHHADAEGAPAAKRMMQLMIMQDEDPKVHEMQAVAKTTFTLPKGGGRSEQLSYDGLRLASRTPMKNGLMHGESTYYGYNMKVGFLLPDLKVPTTTYCYQNGQMVKTSPCPAD